MPPTCAGCRLVDATLLVLLTAAAAPVLLIADDQESPRPGGVRLSNVSIGIAGNYQVGRWTAIEADVDSDSWPVTLSVRAVDPDGNLTRQPSAEIPQPQTPPARVRSLFKTGRLTDNDDSSKADGFDGLLQVDLETPEGITTFHLTASGAASEATLQVPSLKDAWTLKTRLWAALGGADGFEQAARRIVDRSGGSRRPVHLIKLEDDSQLPTTEDALQSLAMLVVTGRQAISPQTSEAIRRWVFAGGHLVLSVDSPGDFEALPMSSWLPVRVTGQSRLRDLSNLTTHFPGSAPIRVSIVEALQFEFDHGEAVASTLDGPLWARVPYGFGQVTLLGVDLSRRPLSAWESLPLLCEKLSGMERRGQQQSAGNTTAQLSQTGVSDLQTQLVAGLDHFPASRKPTTWLAMGLIVLYLLVIGPLDYLIVHKILRRPHWTWVTFPLLVVLAALGVAVAARDRNPQAMLANQVDVVDIDVATSSSRVNSWVSFTSPASRRYQVGATQSVAPGSTEAPPPRICWSAIPETGFRGMYRVGGLNQWKTDYSFAPDDQQILDLPIAVWSSANCRAEWSPQPTSAGEVLEADLFTSPGQLHGTLTNRLSVPVNDWFIAWQRRVYIPQTRATGAAALRIAPGEMIDLDNRRRVEPRLLESYLTGLRRFEARSRPNQTGKNWTAGRDIYDPLERDPYSLWRIASFFTAARGEEFTSLSGDALDRFDLSPLLDLDRAVLFCRVETAAVDFLVDDQPLDTTEHETILRIVIPVN